MAEPEFHSASHAALFEAAATDTPAAARDDRSARCDVCGEAADDDADGFAVSGRGLYVWTRGEEVRYEEPPLCAKCGMAIGVMALAQWDLEEDEG